MHRWYNERYMYLLCLLAYPLCLCGHADELLVGYIAAAAAASAASGRLSSFRLKLLDEIALQANGAITIVHLTLERETILLLQSSAHCMQEATKRHI